MEATIYEKTYRSVNHAMSDTKHLEAVVAFLRKQSEPVTCETIGRAVFGKKYKGHYMSKSCQRIMGQVLRHLRLGGFIKVEEHKGDPIEIEVEDWVFGPDSNEEPYEITVHDDKGRVYTIRNPHWKSTAARGHWETVKKTVIPTIKTYIWIAD